MLLLTTTTTTQEFLDDVDLVGVARTRTNRDVRHRVAVEWRMGRSSRQRSRLQRRGGEGRQAFQRTLPPIDGEPTTNVEKRLFAIAVVERRVIAVAISNGIIAIDVRAKQPRRAVAVASASIVVVPADVIVAAIAPPPMSSSSFRGQRRRFQ